MKLRKPQYVHGFIDRHGKPRFYLRRPGAAKQIPLPGLPYSPDFMAAYEAAMKGEPERIVIGAGRSAPGTVSAVIASYYSHELWLEKLSKASRDMRRPILEHFRADHGDKRVALLQPQHISKILAPKKRFAKRNWLKTFRGLMAFCLQEQHITVDPTQGVKLLPGSKSSGHMTWKEDQVEQYRNHHAIGTMPRLALELLLNVAARRQDVYQLGRPHLRGGKLSWRPSKTRRSTGKLLTIRATAEFLAASAAMPATGSLTFLTTDYGKPFASAAGFGNKFADWCIDAGLKPVVCDDGRTRNFRAHGLRKAACRFLAHAGCTAPEIMAISGHSTLAQVQVYIEEVEQARLADTAMDKRATSIGKPANPVSQSGS